MAFSGRRRALEAISLALAAAGALTTPVAMAADNAAAEAAAAPASAPATSTMATSEVPSDPVSDRALEKTAADQERPAQPSGPMAQSEGERSVFAQAAPETRPKTTAPLYGPPVPLSVRGKLPEVGWTEAPSDIPPALDRAVQTVTRNYPSAKAARAALRAAASDVRSAKWQRFPTVSADLVYLDADSSPQPQLVVEMPIWAGGRIGAAIERAEASETVTSAQYVETVHSLALTTAATYYQIAQLTQREQLLAASVIEHNKLVGTMERRVEQEVSPLADLELARSRAAQIEQEFNVTRAQRQSALRVLAELIADPNYDLGPIPFYDPNDELEDREALEDQTVAYDPTRQRLMNQVRVVSAEYDQAKASLLPQFNTQYRYDDVFGSRMGVVVRMQTAAGLSQFSQIDSARLRIEAANQQVVTVEQQLRRQVANDIIEYEAARARASISLRASDTASRVSASYMRQFIAGRRSWLDVMNALREAVNAQIGRSDAEVTAMAAETRLILRSGRWHPNFTSPSQAIAQSQ